MPQTIRIQFEQEFRRHFHVADAIAVNSGTSALIAALWSVRFEEGDEVITTPFTFAATTHAILIAGASPVFVDIKASDHLIDEALIEQAISPRTRAIVPVHLFGRVCNMRAILDIARSHDLFVVEDAAQAFGAKYPANGSSWHYAGTLGDAGCFSFYTTKNFSTMEGGMIAIPGESRLDANAIRAIAHPTSNKPTFKELGFNFRMPAPCALIGYERLKLHMKGSVAELGQYDEEDGFYPHLTYDTKACRQRGIVGQCPVAEDVVRSIRDQHHND